MTAICALRTLSETPRDSSRFGSKPVQPDRVLTLKRTDIDENTYVLNKRPKSRPHLAAVSGQGGAYSPVAFFCARTLRAAIPLWFRITPNVARKLQRPALPGGPKSSLIVERWSWPMETTRP